MNIVEEIKSLAILIKKIDDIPLYQKILDIQSQALQLLEQNNQLKEENKDLKERLKIKEELSLKNDSYWIENEGPYCTKCWDDEQKMIRMHPCGNPAYYECPKCKSNPVLVKPELDTVSSMITTSQDPDPFF